MGKHSTNYQQSLDEQKKLISAARDEESKLLESYLQPTPADYPPVASIQDVVLEEQLIAQGRQYQEPQLSPEEFFEYDPNDLSEPDYLANGTAADRILPGVIAVDQLSPAIGDDINISANNTIRVHQPTGTVLESENLIVPVGSKVTVNAQGTYEVVPPLAGGLPGPDSYEASFKDDLAEASIFNEQTSERVLNNFFSETCSADEDVFFIDYKENGTSLNISGPGRYLAKTLKTLLRHG